jgi:hypothetical protein
MPIFQYEAYRNPYGPSIAEALAHQADPQAAAALRRGDIDARAAEQRGTLLAQQFSALGAIPGEIQAQRDAQQTRQLKGQEQQLRAQQIGLQGQQITSALEDKQRQRAADAAFAKALAATPLKDDGTYDVPGIAKAIDPAFGAFAVPQFQHLTTVNAALQGQATKDRQESDRAATGILAAGASPVLTDSWLVTAAARHRITSEQLAQYRQILAADPTQAKAILRSFIGPPKGENVPEGTVRVDEVTSEPLFTNAKPPKTAVVNGQVINEATGERIGAPVPMQTPPPKTLVINGQLVREDTGERVGTPVPKQVDPTAAGDVTTLTPAGLDAAALNYAKTGLLPPLGMGDKSTRKAIINRAAEMMPGLDIASAKADYAANTQSLQSMQKQRDAIGAFEQTARKNIDIFLAAAGKVVDTGSPLANGLVRQVTGKMLGSPDQAAYDAARQVAVNEIAKIVSNPTLAGTLSDSARHEVDAFNPGTATLAQSVRVMRLLKQDMDNRTAALDDALGGIKARIKKGAPETGGGVKVLSIVPVP